ncbi:hypothetical protein B0T18DRAFT_389729 [Schizothecium vesticola]|uniref:Uncharacterized protein n=1 Tax=Schizothecium vesticola TaxID=314040 RepID=A0AA40F311_9PEZI|nr:hypothetical protein B0T18DRAFT_389729 [Schizothecium vesticola]
MSQRSSKGDIIRKIQSELASKWTRHAAEIHKYWRSFDPKKRVECINAVATDEAGAVQSIVLKHPLDRSVGNLYKIIPEYNLVDLSSGPSFLLDMLKHRATHSPEDQYAAGVNGQLGDKDFIVEMMKKRNLPPEETSKDCHTFFLDGSAYGETVEITDLDKAKVLPEMDRVIQLGFCIPHSVGELVLKRQMYLLSALHVLVVKILEEGSTRRAESKSVKGADKIKLSLPSLRATARDQKDSLAEHLELLTTEPAVLAHSVNDCYFSRPELIPDEKGRVLPAVTDKYISGAVFDAVHCAVRSIAIWDYIIRLLDLLSSTKDKTYRAILLQELANVCHLEYSRAQAVFRAQVQTGSGLKSFYRRSNVVDKAGRSSTALKVKPQDLALANTLLHHLLRLCQPETTPPKALEWIKKLIGLHSTHPAEREKLPDRESSALCDLAVIVSFLRDLSAAVSLPSLSRKHSQMFVSRADDLDVELNTSIKPTINLLAFASPIDNLLEPDTAAAALRALDAFVVTTTGTTMGFLYQDLIDDCVAHLDTLHQRAKYPAAPLDLPEQLPLATRVEQRKQKDKSRPPTQTTTLFPIVPPPAPAPADAPVTVPITVSAATAAVFSTLFSKTEAAGVLVWTSFCAAMEELGFAREPKFGSVVAFYPPPRLAEEGKGGVVVRRPQDEGGAFEEWAVREVGRRLAGRFDR